MYAADHARTVPNKLKHTCDCFFSWPFIGLPVFCGRRHNSVLVTLQLKAAGLLQPSVDLQIIILRIEI